MLQEEYRGFRIVGDGTFSMKHIKVRGKGSIPLCLEGAYTNSTFAQHSIDDYLETRGPKNGKTNDSSGS